MRREHITISPRNGAQNAARLALLAARADLQLRLQTREVLAVERYPELLDNVENLQARERSALVASAATDRLREITDALQRLDAGRWGVCEACGEAIPPARLAALPWASLCVSCQEAAELALVESL